MKKLLVSLTILFSIIIHSQKANALEPKQKAFMVMCAYGTVGGSLLGFASMAFGSNSRAIAQGASLGLYAGIIFGAYVVSSHRSANEPVPDPYAPQDPYGAPGGYGTPGGGGGGGFGAPPPQEEQGGFFGSRVEEINMKMMNNFEPSYKKDALSKLPIYINFFNATF